MCSSDLVSSNSRTGFPLNRCVFSLTRSKIIMVSFMEYPTKRDLIKFAKERLAHFKVPRSVEFVDSFPLSGTGKILRRVLRQQAAEKGL